MKFRKYKKGDETELVNLFNSCFDKKINLDYWNWKYRDNPYGFDITVAINNEGKIVGQYCDLFKKGIYFNKLYNFINVVDLCCKKEYRGNFIEKILKTQIFPFEFVSINFPQEFIRNKVKNHKMTDGLIKPLILQKKNTFF